MRQHKMHLTRSERGNRDSQIKLRNYQHWFGNYLLAEPGARAAETNNHIARPLLQAIKGNSDTEKQIRLGIYRNNVQASLSSALAELYPVCASLVGQDFFRTLGTRYLCQHPPQQPALVTYGGDFPAFVRSCEQCNSLPYLADVATLELALHRAYHAADRAPLTAVQISQIPPRELIETPLGIHPSVQLVYSDYPVNAIWQMHQEEHASPVDLDQGAERVLIIRPAYQVQRYQINPSEHSLVAALLAGDSLGDALDALDAVMTSQTGLTQLQQCASDNNESRFDPGKAISWLIRIGFFTASKDPT